MNKQLKEYGTPAVVGAAVFILTPLVVGVIPSNIEALNYNIFGVITVAQLAAAGVSAYVAGLVVNKLGWN